VPTVLKAGTDSQDRTSQSDFWSFKLLGDRYHPYQLGVSPLNFPLFILYDIMKKVVGCLGMKKKEKLEGDRQAARAE